MDNKLCLIMSVRVSAMTNRGALGSNTNLHRLPVLTALGGRQIHVLRVTLLGTILTALRLATRTLKQAMV